MKKLLIAALVTLHLQVHAQVATYAPLNADFSDSITLFFNLNLATDPRSQGLLDRKSGLYLWMGAGTGTNPFEYTPAAQKDFAQPVPGAELTPVGANLWQIKLNPATWAGVPAGKTITVLALIVKNANGTAQTEDIVLKPTTTQALENVVVKASKPFIEKQADKTVLNIQQDVVASGGTMFEAIQRAPGISITNNETMVMSGKSGVQVLIDGRPTQLSDQELANWLKASPAALVATIEIITNPSGKYDAQGNAGIINIRLKKQNLRGLNGTLSSSYTQSTHHRANANGTINYRSGKWNLYANTAASDVLQHTDGRILRQLPGQQVFDNRTTDIDQGTSGNLRAGADWYINKQHTLGVLVRTNLYHNPMRTPGITLMQSQGDTDSLLLTDNRNDFRNKNHGINLNYQWQDTSGATWNLDADYNQFTNRSRGQINTIFSDKTGRPFRLDGNLLNLNNDINLWALRSDYSTTLKRWKTKLETGAKAARSMTTNLMDASLLQQNNMVPDTGRSNDFRYRESIYAAYANLQKAVGKWTLQAGLRLEYTDANGRSTDLKGQTIPKPDTSYLNAFPSLFVRYAFNDKNSLGVSASRRINRPSYQDLNPFENVYDHYTFERGNPYLRPSYLTNLELNYNYRGALDISLGHSITSDYFQTISEQVGNYTYATIQNIGTQRNWFANISLGLPIKPWWFSYNSLNGFYNQYRGSIPSGNISNSAFGMGWYTQQSFSLGETWKLQLSSWGNSGTRDALFRTAWLGSVDLGAAKSLADGTWNIRLSVLDLFNTQRWKQTVDFADMNFTYERKWESRGVRLQVTWKFGKTSFSARERSRGSEAEENRVKAKS